ncbi:hypothetical protein BDZ45DRAFT_65034 [Acephala macrosclerotiorum]|nr:hypothetical protein BDZ45DRAFT_65034 [Acephala macrosclerotiorum]
MADMLSSIKRLLETEKYADLTLICGGEIIKVHCAIVCTRCPFLSKAVDGKFREAALREIDLSVDELPVIRAMVKYLYTDEYDDAAIAHVASAASPPVLCDWCDNNGFSAVHSLPVHNDEAFPLMFNVKMYIAGDKYDIPGLRVLATKKFKTCVAQHWNNSTFSEAAQHLWENTIDSDRQLRNVVIKTAHKNIDQLLDRGEFVDLMKSHGEFGLDIVKMMRGRSLDEVVLEEVPCSPPPRLRRRSLSCSRPCSRSLSYSRPCSPVRPCSRPCSPPAIDFGWGASQSKKGKGKK